MLNEQLVVGVMRSALLSVCKGSNIELKHLRIRMKLNKDLESTECSAFSKGDELDPISWGKILGIKAIAFKRQVVDGITTKLHSLANVNGIKEDSVNVRVYATDINGTPSMFLFDGNKSLKKIDLKELI